MGLKLVTAKTLLHFKENLDTYYFNIINEKLEKKVNNDDYASNTSYGIVKADGRTILSKDGVLSASSIGGVNYSTEEQNTGLKWIDRNDIYQQTIVLDTPLDYVGNDWIDVTNVATDALQVIDVVAYNTSANEIFHTSGKIKNGKIQIKYYDDISINSITVRYTKDTAMEYASDYKWDELSNSVWDDLIDTKWKNNERRKR